MAVVPSPQPARVDRAWSASLDEAIAEAERAIPVKHHSVLLLVRVVARECRNAGRPWLELSRRQLVESLGYKGARYPAGSKERGAAEEAVRKLLRRAELAGEIVVTRTAGRPQRVALVRVLQRLSTPAGWSRELH